jgi:hypothetical protein
MSWKINTLYFAKEIRYTLKHFKRDIRFTLCSFFISFFSLLPHYIHHVIYTRFILERERELTKKEKTTCYSRTLVVKHEILLPQLN